jgi:methionine biosynthesis protein MetW
MDVQTFENDRWSQKPQQPEFRHGAALSLVQNANALDIGCGDGLLLSMLTGISAEGVDLSDVAVASCASKGLKAVQGDFTKDPLPFADKSFQTVIALDVLEHVYEPAAVLAEMTRVSSKNIIIGVPNFSSLPARLQTLFGKVPENNHAHKGHVYWFNWPVLTHLVQTHNLRITRVKVNAPLERLPLVGSVTKGLAELWPNLFALSFVILCER